ncbi:MAG: hypothetical protein HKN76_00685 [Saprospiraceae bacterium]|nr:hypothetical protein [Saprospiraceae bacterium]
MPFVLDDIIDRFWKDGRIKELEELARTEGYHFSMRDRLDLQTYKIKNFRLFQGRKAKRLRGILSRTIDSIQVRIYDYVYYAESHKKKTTVFELFDDQLELLPFIIRPKRSIQWLKEVFHRNTSFFPQASAFHAYYEIDTQHQRNIDAQFTEDFIDLISSIKHVSVEGQGAYLLVYFRNTIVPAYEIGVKLDLTLQLLDSLYETEQSDQLL